MQLDSSQVTDHWLGQSPCDAASSAITSAHPTTALPSQGRASFVANKAKKIRTDQVDILLSRVSPLGQSRSLHMTPTSVGAPYKQAAAAAAAASDLSSLTHYTQGPRLHHHHHLPGSSHLGNFTPSEVGSGAPSMVGQAGMPAPAPRPSGSKLKFTAEDDQLLTELKEQKKLTWKQIVDFFPGRSSGTLQVQNCTKLKSKTTQWTDSMVGAPP